MAEERKRLPDVIRRLDPDNADDIPVDPNVLIAGCGTGQEAARIALIYPDATITAIDLSDAESPVCSSAMRHARDRQYPLRKARPSPRRRTKRTVRCRLLFGRPSSPPRSGAWMEYSSGCLRPGGVMKIMVYGRIARLWVDAARTVIRDLAGEQVSDDLLRQVRSRIMLRTEGPAAYIARSAILPRSRERTIFCSTATKIHLISRVSHARWTASDFACWHLCCRRLMPGGATTRGFPTMRCTRCRMLGHVWRRTSL